MNKRRLLALADFMETVPRKHFDMNYWLKVFVWSGYQKLIDVDHGEGEKKLGECGTAACALGWATQVPALRRAGCTKNAILTSARGTGMRVFDIDDSTFGDLFANSDNRTPKQWAKHCRKIVAEHVAGVYHATKIGSRGRPVYNGSLELRRLPYK